MSEASDTRAGRARTAHPAAGLFIAGTDTEVGKTLVSVSIVRALVALGLEVAAMKPVAAGASSTPQGRRNSDALALARAASVAAPYERINPYCLSAPVSPHIAAAEEGVVIEVAQIRQRFDELAADADCVVVEGAGGWLAPIGDRDTLADVARALSLPVVLVVGLRLGCLNHALLSARAIRSDGLELAGWIGNAVDPAFERPAENLASLERRLGSAPLALVPYLNRAAERGFSGEGSPDEARLEPGVALPREASAALVALCTRPRGGRPPAGC